MDPIRNDTTRHEIAAISAQFIADGGLDYQSAKRKAIRQVLGEAHPAQRLLPDNELVDQYLLEHLRLFDSGHAARVRRARELALHWMTMLHEFHAYLTGSAWKGIMTSHAPVHLQVFTELGKELEMRLLDEGIDFAVDEIDHFNGRGRVPVLQFHWRDEPIMISVYSEDDLRGALKRQTQVDGRERPARGDASAVRALIDEDAEGDAAGDADGD